MLDPGVVSSEKRLRRRLGLRFEVTWNLLLINMADEESGFVQARFTTKQIR